ncbi:MAG: CdaR family protein [Balneolaceae bacterium]
MADNEKNIILERIKRFFKAGAPSPDQDVRSKRRERIAVFIIAYIMALSLWFIVNLNGDYRITINIPVEAGAVPPDMALVDGLPEFLQVEVSGDGWKLVNLYSNPPEIPIDVIEGEVNLFEQVRQRFTVEQDVSVLKVQPLFINIGLEPRISKKIPIELLTVLEFEDRYGLVSEPVFSPDSITITGAQSHVDEIDRWLIPDTLSLMNVRENISETIEISSIDPLIEYDIEEITYNANVSEFTEGEVSVYIRTQNIPRGSIINYNPSTVTIRFDIPIEQYNELQNQRPYEVYVPYQEILEDSTGFVTPDIELVATQYQIKLRSFQPKAVAYFSVLDE